MKKTKAYYLSEEIDPILWESVSDAYNDLSVYAYHFIAYKSDKYPIPEELIGDAVLMACERAFKYRHGFNIEISKLHNWINTIIKRVLFGIHNKLPEVQRLDAIINRAVTDFETDYDLGYYWAVESGCYDLSNMGHLANYFDYESFGRDIRFETDGGFTSYGWIERC